MLWPTRRAGSKSTTTRINWRPAIRKAIRRTSPYRGMRPVLAFVSAGMQRALNEVPSGPLPAVGVLRELKWNEVMGRFRRRPRDPDEALRQFLAGVDRIIDGAQREQQLAMRAARGVTSRRGPRIV